MKVSPVYLLHRFQLQSDGGDHLADLPRWPVNKRLGNPKGALRALSSLSLSAGHLPTWYILLLGNQKSWLLPFGSIDYDDCECDNYIVCSSEIVDDCPIWEGQLVWTKCTSFLAYRFLDVPSNDQDHDNRNCDVVLIIKRPTLLWFVLHNVKQNLLLFN